MQNHSDPSGDQGTKREQVEFYPGEKLLLHLVNDKVMLRAEAWGGPSKPEPKGKGKEMAREPTWPGAFVIGGQEDTEPTVGQNQEYAGVRQYDDTGAGPRKWNMKNRRANGVLLPESSSGR